MTTGYMTVYRFFFLTLRKKKEEKKVMRHNSAHRVFAIASCDFSARALRMLRHETLLLLSTVQSCSLASCLRLPFRCLRLTPLCRPEDATRRSTHGRGSLQRLFFDTREYYSTPTGIVYMCEYSTYRRVVDSCLLLDPEPA
jgi:hypothetical protein